LNCPDGPVPIAVAGPPAATAQITAALARSRPGAFEVTAVADTAAGHRPGLSGGRVAVTPAPFAGPGPVTITGRG
jgi:acylphosphatase